MNHSFVCNSTEAEWKRWWMKMFFFSFSLFSSLFIYVERQHPVRALPVMFTRRSLLLFVCYKYIYIHLVVAEKKKFHPGLFQVSQASRNSLSKRYLLALQPRNVLLWPYRFTIDNGRRVFFSWNVRFVLQLKWHQTCGGRDGLPVCKREACCSVAAIGADLWDR